MNDEWRSGCVLRIAQSRLWTLGSRLSALGDRRNIRSNPPLSSTPESLSTTLPQGCLPRMKQAAGSGQWIVGSKTLQEADPFINHQSSFILHPSSFILPHSLPPSARAARAL